MNDVIAQLIERCDYEEAITVSDIAKLAKQAGQSVEEFYESTLLTVAKAFLQSNLSFETADAVANCLWRVSEFDLQGLSREIFIAFDDGEFKHRKDSLSANPVELYTKPRLNEILHRE